jgi:hypothetical protein
MEDGATEQEEKGCRGGSDDRLRAGLYWATRFPLKPHARSTAGAVRPERAAPNASSAMLFALKELLMAENSPTTQTGFGVEGRMALAIRGAPSARYFVPPW